MRSRCAPCVLTLAALCGQLAIVAPASAGEPLRLGLGALRTEGLSDAGAQQTRRLVFEQLAALQVEIQTEASALQLESGCFKVPGCVAKRVEGLGLHGVLDVLVRRVGPLVNVRLRMFDAANGLKLFETEFSSPARTYPQPDQFRADLDRALAALRRQHPEIEAPGEVAGSIGDGDGDGLWGPLSWGALGVGGLALLSGAAAGSYWLVLRQQLVDSGQCNGDACVREGVVAQNEEPYIGLGFAAPILIGGGLVVSSLGVAGLLMKGGAEDEEEETKDAAAASAGRVAAQRRVAWRE